MTIFVFTRFVGDLSHRIVRLSPTVIYFKVRISKYRTPLLHLRPTWTPYPTALPPGAVFPRGRATSDPSGERAPADRWDRCWSSGTRVPGTGRRFRGRAGFPLRLRA